MKKFILGIAFLFITLITSLNAEVIIDVRTIDEYNSGHIENSLNIEWQAIDEINHSICLLYTSPSPRDPKTSRMPSSA